MVKEEKKKDSKVLSVVGLILCVILGFMLICNVTIIVKGTISSEKPPSVFGITPMVVLSGSMSGDAEDHIEVGDLVFVDKVNAKDLKVGNVIAFMEGSIVVTHRIVEITEDENGNPQFVTKGDANNAIDSGVVTEENFVGIYRARLPKVGDFALFLQTSMGMLLFIGVPLLIFIIYDIIRRQKYAINEKNRAAEAEAEIARLRQLVKESESNV